MPGFLKNLFVGKTQKETKQETPWEEKAELTETAESCYRRGKEYQRKGDLERARLYLERASTLYSNYEQVFEESEVLMEDCDEQIGALEEEDLLYNELLEQVTEKAEELSNRQNYIWAILSLARFQTIFAQLSGCPDCEILGEMKRVLDIFCHGITDRITEEEQAYLHDFITRFYDFGDSEAFADTKNQVPVREGYALQVLDLNGNSTLTCMHILLDKCIHLFDEGFDMAEDAELAETDFIPCTVMEDYYLRTHAEELRGLLEVQEEIARIWSDYEFVQEESDVQKITERIRTYQNMDILHFSS